MANYKILTNEVKGKNELVDYQNVNLALDKMLVNCDKGAKIIRINALICDIEGRIGNRSRDIFLSLGVSFLIASTTLFAEIAFQDILNTTPATIFLLTSIGYLTIGSIKCIRGYSCNSLDFVINVLKFRLEETMNEEYKDVLNEKQYIVTIQRNTSPSGGTSHNKR